MLFFHTMMLQQCNIDWTSIAKLIMIAVYKFISGKKKSPRLVELFLQADGEGMYGGDIFLSCFFKRKLFAFLHSFKTFNILLQ
jgi:hypothetical protein